MRALQVPQKKPLHGLSEGQQLRVPNQVYPPQVSRQPAHPQGRFLYLKVQQGSSGLLYDSKGNVLLKPLLINK